jgi:BASS family bile acid:Na+ symporter
MLTNRNIIFSLAMLTGLIFPQLSSCMEPLIFPVLALIMTMATTNVPDNFFKSFRSLFVPSLAGILMNYLILGGTTLAMSAWLINQEDIWIGFVLVAAVPPAVAVIPFTNILGGNTSYTLAGTVAAYIGALVIMPFTFLILIGTDFAVTPKLMRIMILLIALPVVASRIIIRTGINNRIAPYQGLITNWGFFIVLYTLVGLNRETIFRDPLMLVPVAAILFVSTFVLGILIEWIGNLLNINQENIISLVLLGTMKNQAIAGGLAISLFTREAALPAAVSSVFLILFFIWLDIKKRWKTGRN